MSSAPSPGYRVIPIMQYVEAGPRGYKVIWPPDRAAASFVNKAQPLKVASVR